MRINWTVIKLFFLYEYAGHILLYSDVNCSYNRDLTSICVICLEFLFFIILHWDRRWTLWVLLLCYRSKKIHVTSDSKRTATTSHDAWNTHSTNVLCASAGSKVIWSTVHAGYAKCLICIEIVLGCLRPCYCGSVCVYIFFLEHEFNFFIFLALLLNNKQINNLILAPTFVLSFWYISVTMELKFESCSDSFTI